MERINNRLGAKIITFKEYLQLAKEKPNFHILPYRYWEVSEDSLGYVDAHDFVFVDFSQNAFETIKGGLE